MYDGVCTITVNEEYTKENGASGFRPTVLRENEPCRLSFVSAGTKMGDAATETIHEAKLFLTPDIEVPAGSHITVTQNNVTREYNLSTIPAVYATHQEIVFSTKDRWA
jgi:hypothetical protein